MTWNNSANLRITGRMRQSWKLEGDRGWDQEQLKLTGPRVWTCEEQQHWICTVLKSLLYLTPQKRIKKGLAECLYLCIIPSTSSHCPWLSRSSHTGNRPEISFTHSANLKPGTGIKDSKLGIPLSVNKSFILSLGSNNYLHLWLTDLLL